ncbi:MAG: LacI family DNA-binding transcriptional regulator, partial [Pseudomonadota bacterium]
MGLRNTTIEDVAKAAGVSRQTVSRVINRRSNVKDAVRARVEEAIAELGYVPNAAARRMGGARSYLLLAVIERGA